MYRIFLLILMMSAYVLSGCGSSQTIKDSWKFTKRQYSNYLNTPASLNLEDRGSCEVYEIALGDSVLRVDEQLQNFMRAMQNSDHNPGPEWVMNMLTRFPWLSGLALVDGQGNLHAQYPEYFAKTFEVGPLLEPDPKQRMGDLRAYVQMHSAGPEVYVANPVFGKDEMRGVIVAYFDPRALVMFSPDPGNFVIASPNGVIWPGNFGGGGPMASVDWAELLTRKSCGVIGDSSTGFYWTTRYIGNLPLVYGVPISAGKAVAERQEAEAQRRAAMEKQQAAAVEDAPQEQPESAPLEYMPISQRRPQDVEPAPQAE